VKHLPIADVAARHLNPSIPPRRSLMGVPLWNGTGLRSSAEDGTQERATVARIKATPFQLPDIQLQIRIVRYNTAPVI
jgi:hypothetical protein